MGQPPTSSRVGGSLTAMDQKLPHSCTAHRDLDSYFQRNWSYPIQSSKKWTLSIQATDFHVKNTVRKACTMRRWHISSNVSVERKHPSPARRKVCSICKWSTQPMKAPGRGRLWRLEHHRAERRRAFRRS